MRGGGGTWFLRLVAGTGRPVGPAKGMVHKSKGVNARNSWQLLPGRFWVVALDHDASTSRSQLQMPADPPNDDTETLSGQ
jgi:hypothetical protein